MTPARSSETRNEEIFAALETNHYNVKHLNKTFYMKRGQGPFGALGNKPSSGGQGLQGTTSFLETEESPGTLDLELGLAQTSVPIMQMKDVGVFVIFLSMTVQGEYVVCIFTFRCKLNCTPNPIE